MDKFFQDDASVADEPEVVEDFGPSYPDQLCDTRRTKARWNPRDAKYPANPTCRDDHKWVLFADDIGDIVKCKKCGALQYEFVWLDPVRGDEIEIDETAITREYTRTPAIEYDKRADAERAVKRRQAEAEKDRVKARKRYNQHGDENQKPLI